MASITPEQALIALQEAELLYSPTQISETMDRMATRISAALAHRDPLVLLVMNGGFVLGAHLLARLNFPLRVGYLHATRYRGQTRGGEIIWLAHPRPSVTDQVVLVVDDIFDEGDTLQSILAEIHQAGAQAVYSAVLVNKRHDRKPAGLTVDFVGLDAPDRYVFGCGMDYQEYWRNLTAIYAARE